MLHCSCFGPFLSFFSVRLRSKWKSRNRIRRGSGSASSGSGRSVGCCSFDCGWVAEALRLPLCNTLLLSGTESARRESTKSKKSQQRHGLSWCWCCCLGRVPLHHQHTTKARGPIQRALINNNINFSRLRLCTHTQPLTQTKIPVKKERERNRLALGCTLALLFLFFSYPL